MILRNFLEIAKDLQLISSQCSTHIETSQLILNAKSIDWFLWVEHWREMDSVMDLFNASSISNRVKKNTIAIDCHSCGR